MMHLVTLPKALTLPIRGETVPVVEVLLAT